jgi:hypothetical protein
MDDDTPHFPRKGAQLLMEEILLAATTILEGLEETPAVRVLRGQARTYERVLAMWKTVKPTDDRRDATFELVTELYNRAAALRDAASGGKQG